MNGLKMVEPILLYYGVMILSEVCFICKGSDDVKFCKLCQHYLCVHCKNNPPKRLLAFLKEKLGK